MSALPLRPSFTGEGESLQTDESANERACPSFLLAYIISPLGVDEEEEEEGGERERERGGRREKEGMRDRERREEGGEREGKVREKRMSAKEQETIDERTRGRVEKEGGRERERASVGGFGFAQRPWLLSSSSSSSLLHTLPLSFSLSLLFNLVFIYLSNFLFLVFVSLD